jgi:hypothetical protein
MTIKLGEQLRWNEDLGVGYLPVGADGTEYTYEYWTKYHEYKQSPIAEKLMQVRVDLVEKHSPNAKIVDIGIGSGHFIEVREERANYPLNHSGVKRITFGYDVNPHAITWLISHKLWFDPWATDPEIVTCWDSLEHLPRPHEFLARVRSMIYVSIPIFRDKEHCLTSKHFKPGEHLWYFTRTGFINYMKRLGFGLIDENQMETKLGREEIGTFVFRR